MNGPIKTCPKCQGALTELKGGLWRCPACGRTFEKANTHQRFWILLLLPSALALLSFLIGQIRDEGNNAAQIGMLIGMIDLAVGLGASIYCGVWLAWRFFKSETARVLLGLLFIFGIGFVNFMIICAGCVPNLKF